MLADIHECNVLELSITSAEKISTHDRFLIATMVVSSALIGAWELSITRVASILFFYDVAYLILALCLFALGVGALLAKQLPTSITPIHLSFGLVFSLIVVYPCLYWFEPAWLLGLFTIPFFVFGLLAAEVWRQVAGIRARVWLYGCELAGVVAGLILIGPMLVAVLPVDVLGTFGVNNHLRETVAEEGLVTHSSQSNSFARTDFLETGRESVKYVFTDGMFVTRSVAWDGVSKTFADAHVEKLANLKRFTFRINSSRRVALLGAGAGFDVAVALQEGAEHIAAIEVNAATIEYARRHDEWAGGVLSRPEVDIHISEARRYMERNDQFFDQINLTLLQTPTASIRGPQHIDARVLTVEAVQTYLSRLSDKGVVVVIQNTTELAAATEAVALKAVDGNQDHVLGFQLSSEEINPFSHLIVLGKTAFTTADIANLEQLASELGIQRVVSFGSIAAVAIDDRPFFFLPNQQVPLQSVLVISFAVLIIGLLLYLQSTGSQALVISGAALMTGMSTMAFQVLAVHWCHSAVGIPTWAVATALASVLAGSGIGVALLGRWSVGIPWWQTGLLGAIGILLSIIVIPVVVSTAIENNLQLAALIMGTSLAMFSIPLGLPFLATMQQAHELDHGEGIVVGFDGLGALVGAAAATFIAVTLGFTPLGYFVVTGFVLFAVLALLEEMGSK